MREVLAQGPPDLMQPSTELCRVKPEEPVSWLAEWMVANRNPADRNKKRLGDLLS